VARWVWRAALALGGLLGSYVGMSCLLFVLGAHRASLSQQSEAWQPFSPLEPSHRLLIVAPHPDDEVLGCGGLIAEAVRRGALVRVVFLTSGDGYPAAATLLCRSTPTADDFLELGRLRMQEARRMQRRVLFVECNVPEIQQHSRTLNRELGVAVEGVHLDDVRRDPAGFRRQAAEVGCVVTTFFHFEEVQRVIRRAAEVVGLGAGLEIRFLRSLAQLPAGTRVAVCCLDRERAARVRTLVVNAGVRHLAVVAVGVDAPDRFRRALRDAQEVYVSAAAYPVAKRLVGEQGRLHTYQMELDRASLEMLRARLAEMPARLRPQRRRT